MKIKHLKLNNFRQYLGQHHIEFSGYSDPKNVTLIRGANGYGKTGIFRAIMYCLYGDKCLEQDNLSPIEKKEGLTLVNEKLLNENPGETVTAEVELCFSHKNSVYTVTRQIKAYKNSEQEFAQEDGKVTLVEKLSDGNTLSPVEGPEKLKELIEQILPSKLKDFFLFDGERIEHLTRPGKDQKREIQRGIRTLLQLEVLEKSIDALKEQEKKLTNQIKVYSTSDLEYYLEQHLSVKEKLVELENDRKVTEEQLEIADRKLDRVSNQLSENKDSINLQNQRDEKLSSLATNEESLSEYRDILKSSIASITPALAHAPIAELYQELNSKMEKGELPQDIKQEFIDGLLESQICICGTHIAPNSVCGSALNCSVHQQ